jgi:Zn finger protein HypA/HybF involved in hydrogenase expression
MTTLHPLHTTLDQELQALLRGASLECLVCGEFVLRSGGTLSCPECGSHLRPAVESAGAGLQFDTQAG